MSLPTPEQREDELQEVPPVLTSRPDNTVAESSTFQEYHMPHVPVANHLSGHFPLLFMNCTRSIPPAGNNDMQALSFHRTVFGPLKSTRTPSNSAHSIFVTCAVDKQMALHFLLAVAHSELSLYYGIGLDLPPESYLHFDQGSQLLYNASTPQGPADHPDPHRLRELSRVVVDYVQTHRVDEFCVNNDVNIFSQDLSAGLLIPDQVLLARIFTYLYDRDGFCSFFGCGGSFATSVNRDTSKRRKIWTLSRTVFLFSEEDDLPRGTIPEIQDAVILDLYFTLITIHHEINIYSQTGEGHACGDLQKLNHHLDQLKEEHASVFSLVTDSDAQSTAPSLMACVTVTVFFALQIYLHRSRGSGFGADPVCCEVLCALSSLVTAAYNTIAIGPVQLLERFQWSLFIGGIETRDPVHREWIANHLSDPALKKAFQLVQEEKRYAQVTMQSLRRMMGCE
ncbi:hypothetical protein BBP40_009609 [Aspergillus hancockii]|nr:hypothetical protein BBP40_009609 [Aspergillus hancockii]